MCGKSTVQLFGEVVPHTAASAGRAGTVCRLQNGIQLRLFQARVNGKMDELVELGC